MMRPTALLSAIALVAAPAAHALQPRATPESVGLSSARLHDATTLLEQFVADRKVAGAVAAVSRRGKVVYLQAVGVQDLETRVPMSERTLFRIYSMTKPVTAVAVMLLHDAGRFRLQDPVAKYLPEFNELTVAGSEGQSPRRSERAITVEDLLLHTSGLSHRTSELYRKLQVRSREIPLPKFVANIARAPLMEEPGTRFRYSEATTVLGRLVEIWSGKPFDVFLDERIFSPLKMTDTVWAVDADRRPRLATVYASDPSGGLAAAEIETVPFTERPALIEGAVGLVSTVPDYLRFCQMLLNRGELGGVRMLEPDTAARITTNGLPDAILRLRGGSMGWGLANVNVETDRASPLYGEYGWDGTAGTIFWVHPAREMITILMTQSTPPNPDRIRQKFKALVDAAVINQG